MIDHFWDWMYRTVNYALSVLNEMYVNSTMRPFFNLLIIVVATAVIIKYILAPLIGITISGSDKASKEAKSDKAKKPTNTVSEDPDK